MKISGNLVNVPANIVNTVNFLPRLSEEAGTIKVQLKRKLKCKSYFSSENLRPAKVFETARWLTENGSLFKKEKIVLNREWMSMEEKSNSNRQTKINWSCLDVDFNTPSTSYRWSSSNVGTDWKQVSANNIYFCMECVKCMDTLDT